MMRKNPFLPYAQRPGEKRRLTSEERQKIDLEEKARSEAGDILSAENKTEKHRLTPQERYKIYLEEKARSEARDILATKKREKRESAAADKKKKERTQGCLGCLGLVILMVIGAKFCPSELEDPTNSGGGEKRSKTQDQRKVSPPRRSGSFESKTTGLSEKVPEFAFTVKEFISRYNYSLQNLENDTRVSKDSESDNGERLVIKLTSNKKIRFVLTANNVTHRVIDMVFLAQGDGTYGSGLDVIMGAVAVVMAIENPSTAVSQRSRILRDLGFASRDGTTNQTVIVRHGVKYERRRLEDIGMTLSAAPIRTN